MARRLPGLLACLALLIAAVPPALGAPRVSSAASAGRTFAAAARSVDAGGRLIVTGFRLDGQAADTNLELQRVDVWDPAATVLVHSGASTAPAVQGPPDVRYFAGSLAGAPGSTVMLSVDPAGGVTGMAAHGKERWALHRPALSPQAAAAGVAPAGLSSRKAARSGGATAGRQPFHCGASGLEAERPPQAQQPQQAQAVAAQQAGGQGGAARKLLQTAPKIASLALETDGELYKRLGGTTALKNYVGQLIAYANTIFVKEIGVQLRIIWLGIYSDAATDPWPTLKPLPGAQPPLNLDAAQGLTFLRSYWNNPVNKRTGIKRTLVHMLSGQNTTGGIAYRGKLCDQYELGGTAYASYVADYGFTGLMTTLGMQDWSGNSTDYPTQPVCAQTQIGVLPTCTATPVYPGGAGTIMSYCQNVRGRFDDVAMTFGTNHPCGRRPGRVVASMKQHVQDRATKYPACFIPTVPAPPPAPVQGPNGKWATPIVVPNTLPFTSSVFSTYWATGAPLYKCDDYANYRNVYVFRWFATRTYDNAQVTVSSCGRLQNTGVPVLTVRTAPTSTNSGPYGCLGSGAGGCPSGGNAFISTFKAVADTFYYLVVSPMDGKPAPKLSMSISAVMGNPRGSWTNAIGIPVDPYAGSTKPSWLSGEFKSFLPAGVPSSVCNDGSSGRPFIAFKWFSGTKLKNGTAWRATSKLTLSSCYAVGTNAVALSVRSSKNVANPAAGPFTCTTRMASGCGTGKVGFKLDVSVVANTTYWFVVTPLNTATPPASFRLTTALSW